MMRIAGIFFVLLCIGLPAAGVQGQEGRSTESLILESQMMMRRGDFQKASEILEQAVAGKSGDPKLYLHLGNAYRELGWMEEARQTYRTAVQIHAGFIDALAALATLDRQLGNWDEGISSYQQIAAIDPTSARPYLEMAMIYRNQGLATEGRKALQKAYQLNPQFVIQSVRLRQGEIDDLTLLYGPDGDVNLAEAGRNEEPAIAAGSNAHAADAVNGGSVSLGSGQSAEAAKSNSSQEKKYTGDGPDKSHTSAVLLFWAVVLLAWRSARVWKYRS